MGQRQDDIGNQSRAEEGACHNQKRDNNHFPALFCKCFNFVSDGITGIYVAIFIGIPLCNKLYAFLEPKIARLRGEK